MALEKYEEKILSDISEHGWFCISVFDNSGRTPAFSYSVGFIDSLKCAEFIVFGLSTNLMHSMLWRVFRQIKDGVTVSAEGQRWSDVLEGYDCVSRPVHQSQIDKNYLNSALWYWRYTGRDRESVKVFQLFWPGTKQRLFPWEEGCAQEVRDLQPFLYLPREVA